MPQYQPRRRLDVIDVRRVIICGGPGIFTGAAPHGYRLRGRATSISVAFSFNIAPFFAMNAACASGFTTT